MVLSVSVPFCLLHVGVRGRCGHRYRLPGSESYGRPLTHSCRRLPRAATKKADLFLLQSVLATTLLTLLLPTTPEGGLMKCSKCRHENRTGAKFCEECK